MKVRQLRRVLNKGGVMSEKKVKLEKTKEKKVKEKKLKKRKTVWMSRN